MIFPSYDNHFKSHDPVTYQRGIYDAAMRFVKLRRLAVDVGAHVGIFTARMLEDFDTVVSFEPQPDNFICLSENCPGAARHQVALFNGEMTGKLVNPRKDNSGAWEFMPGDTIRALPLDYYTLSQVDLIKIDVQGSEIPVLEGAEQTLKRCKPVLIVECVLKGALNSEIAAYLASLGYSPKEQVRRDVVFAC
jgi:FkbM family methyltransferase